MILPEKITFDSFIRGALMVAGLCLAVYLVRTLSSVLLPFFAALVVAYMMQPLVTFFQRKCHLRNRGLSITAAMILLVAAIILLFSFIIPPMIEQIITLVNLLGEYLQNGKLLGFVPTETELRKLLDQIQSLNINYGSIIEDVTPKLFAFLSSTASMLFSLVSVVMFLMYLIFILIDYDNIEKGIMELIPHRHKGTLVNVARDVKEKMSAYFRGQVLIASIVGVLFAIGFTIIDFPVAIGLGLFIGILNLVPYMQTFGFIPTVLLAMLKATTTGESFWVILVSALAVFAVVQLIQDMILTPRIMGHKMGLNPAVILLSLSVWGSLLGIIGMIIALPLTTILTEYYKAYLRNDSGK